MPHKEAESVKETTLIFFWCDHDATFFFVVVCAMFFFLFFPSTGYHVKWLKMKALGFLLTMISIGINVNQCKITRWEIKMKQSIWRNKRKQQQKKCAVHSVPISKSISIHVTRLISIWIVFSWKNFSVVSNTLKKKKWKWRFG